MYMYMYMCLCVCVCVWVWVGREGKGRDVKRRRRGCAAHEQEAAETIPHTQHTRAHPHSAVKKRKRVDLVEQRAWEGGRDVDQEEKNKDASDSEGRNLR